MNISDQKLLKILDFLLQRQIHLFVIDEIEDKKITIKRGTLLNYNLKVPFIQYTTKLENNKIRDYYLNLPFNCFHGEGNIITFSYKIEDLCEMSEKDLEFLKKLKYSGDSKLYNRNLYIQYEQ